VVNHSFTNKTSFMIRWNKRKPDADPDIPASQMGMFRVSEEILITGPGPNGRRRAEAKNGGTVVQTLFEWVEFKPLPTPIRGKKAQRKYEIWVGAYLNFRTPPKDYEVFFQWDPGDPGPDQSLIIFLSPDPFPPAPPFVADPPSPPAPPPPESSA
jgi:hypothetical protein